MNIKAIHLCENGFMNQAFAFGGEEGREAFDEQICYRSSLQNFAIDLGDEMILVDTAPGGSPDLAQTFGEIRQRNYADYEAKALALARRLAVRAKQA